MPLSKSPDDRDLVNVLLAFDWFDERIFRGILRFANENKWHLSPYHFSDYSLPEGWPGDGAITCYGDNIKAQIEKLDMPWVDITAKPFEAICPRVYVDDDIIGRIAANHFVNRGFKRFGFFDWKLECVTVNQLRKDAYFDELRKKGFDEADFYLIEQSEGDILNNFELHRRHILAQLELLPRPIGIYTGQDNLAADLVEICGRNNIHVPEEVAILGTDNIELICKSSLVPISSIDANFGELGYRAAQRLQQLMDGEISNDADPVKIEPKGLVRRRSTDVLAVKHPKVAEAIREIKAQTDKPFGVDLLLPKHLDLGGGMGMKDVDELPLSKILEKFPKSHIDWFNKVKKEMQLPDVEIMVRMNTTTMRPKESIQVCLEERVPLFCAGLGNPGFMVEDAHAFGIKVLGITGNAKNAKRMAESGIDLLVAQGHEGGGHTGRIGTMVLLPAAIDAANPVPVLAAGGIGDGRGIAASLAMGCIGVWVGTRFLATNEGGALDINKQKIVESSDEGTRVSRAYTGKTLRASFNRYHDIWDASKLKPLPFPTQVLLSSALLASFIEANKTAYVGGLAGQVSALINEIKPAGQVLEEMVEEAVDILTRKLTENVVAK